MGRYTWIAIILGRIYSIGSNLESLVDFEVKIAWIVTKTKKCTEHTILIYCITVTWKIPYISINLFREFWGKHFCQKKINSDQQLNLKWFIKVFFSM